MASCRWNANEGHGTVQRGEEGGRSGADVYRCPVPTAQLISQSQSLGSHVTYHTHSLSIATAQHWGKTREQQLLSAFTLMRDTHDKLGVEVKQLPGLPLPYVYSILEPIVLRYRSTQHPQDSPQNRWQQGIQWPQLGSSRDPQSTIPGLL
ncbi:unnamed protein product [Pleuronectes platessa]|uniref:Uncharacterized protein n=1 Tax=Pleuronectes platessa TaxID=8262 RepID=A0A9N7VSN5_PLEPL|nr:unnamed protein product [Pleuronectes platessa]